MSEAAEMYRRASEIETERRVAQYSPPVWPRRAQALLADAMDVLADALREKADLVQRVTHLEMDLRTAQNEITNLQTQLRRSLG